MATILSSGPARAELVEHLFPTELCVSPRALADGRSLWRAMSMMLPKL
jgi:hypothetical protein